MPSHQPPTGLTARACSVHWCRRLAGFALKPAGLTVRQLHARLVEIYSSTMAVESVHCHPTHMRWLYDRLETAAPPAFEPKERRDLLRELTRAHTFEATLAARYQSVKRFGIEGGEAIIVGLNWMLRCASGLGVDEVVMGMPHRGRLNVLANVMTKPVEAILSEFRGSAAGTLADEERLRAESNRVFERLDARGNGYLTLSELHRGLLQLGIDATRDEAENAFLMHDPHGTGMLAAHEFFALTLRLLGRNFSGDVKYHLGITQSRTFSGEQAVAGGGEQAGGGGGAHTGAHTGAHAGAHTDGGGGGAQAGGGGQPRKRMSLSLLPNPSHLEAVNPLVVGLARAKQHRLGDRSRKRVLPLLLHGDAAFAAQGVVFETIGLSNLYGFTTGGALHVVLNNQVRTSQQLGVARPPPALHLHPPPPLPAPPCAAVDPPLTFGSRAAALAPPDRLHDVSA